jgi:hypothetical protein
VKKSAERAAFYRVGANLDVVMYGRGNALLRRGDVDLVLNDEEARLLAEAIVEYRESLGSSLRSLTGGSTREPPEPA